MKKLIAVFLLFTGAAFAQSVSLSGGVQVGGGSGTKFRCSQLPASDTITAATGDFATTCTLPGNTLAVGDIIELYGGGIGNNTSGGTVQLKFNFRVGGAAVSYGDVNTNGLITSQSNRPWTTRVYCTVTAIGVSGSITCNGQQTGPNAGGSLYAFSTNILATTIDTTGNTTWTVEQGGSTAANTSSTLKIFLMDVH